MFVVREETAEHAMCCFVDLVTTLLGESAVADDKCECGHSLVVLGVEVQMADNGYSLKPAREKVMNIEDCRVCVVMRIRQISG